MLWLSKGHLKAFGTCKTATWPRQPGRNRLANMRGNAHTPSYVHEHGKKPLRHEPARAPVGGALVARLAAQDEADNGSSPPMAACRATNVLHLSAVAALPWVGRPHVAAHACKGEHLLGSHLMSGSGEGRRSGTILALR